MNRILTEISKISKENFEKYLPEVDLSELEENGKLYYMNDRNGSNFDFFVNNHFSPIMSFYNDEANMGAIKVLLYTDGNVYIYIFKNNENKPFKEIKTSINVSKKEILQLAVIMDKAELDNRFGFGIEDVDSNIDISDEEIDEFLKNNK